MRSLNLEVKEWKSKAGKTGKTVKIGKIGAKGYGMIIGDVIEFECVFEPSIKEIDWTDPVSKVQKTFTAINVLAKPLNHLDFFEPLLDEEYGNVQLGLPNAIAVNKAMSTAEMGDRFAISLVEFTSKKDGKNYIAFKCEQLDVVKSYEKSEDKPAAKVEAKPEVKAETKAKVEVKPVEDDDSELPW